MLIIVLLYKGSTPLEDNILFILPMILGLVSLLELLLIIIDRFFDSNITSKREYEDKYYSTEYLKVLNNYYHHIIDKDKKNK